MISIKLRQALQFRHAKRLIHTLDKVPRSPAPAHDAALFKHAIDGTTLLGDSAEEDPFAVVDVAVHDFGQDLGARPIDRGDAVDVEDDVFIVLGRPDAR